MGTSYINRREALKAAVALGGLPYFVPASVFGQDKAPPSERVTVGFIGVGGRGRGLLRGFMSCKDAQCVAAADAFKSKREAAARVMGGKAYADFRELLAREDIDAVVVATPDHWHVPIAVRAALAGKHAYVEKPLGVTIAEDFLCRKVFQKKQRIFQYGTQQRSMAHCHFGCRLVRAGYIGEVHTIEVVAPNGGRGGSTTPAPVPPDLDYEMWIGPAPMKPYTPDRCKPPGTYWIYDYSIGYLAGWGAHPLDIMVWGSDADLSGPIVIEGTGEIPTEGLYDTVYNWNMHGMLGKVKFKFTPGPDSTKFVGTEGWVQVRRGGIDAEPKSLLKVEFKADDPNLQVSRHHQDNFIKAVKAGRQPVSNLEDAVRSDVISHLCDIAVRLKRRVTWDWSKEQIVGDDEAQKRAGFRPMREPWGWDEILRQV